MDKKTASNFIYNLIYQIISVITPLATTPYIARVLGAEGVGVYSYTSTIALTFALFAALGANTYGQREIAMRQHNEQARSKVFWELFILRAVLSLGVMLAYVVFCFMYNTYTVFLLQAAFIVVSVMFDVSWLYMGMENFKIIASNNIMVKLATVVCVFLFVRKPEDVGIYILINSVSALVTTSYFLLFLPRYVKRVPIAQLDILRHLSGVIQYFIPIIAVQIYSQIDKLMLGAMGNNPSENGYYEQARKLTNLVVVITTALNTVLLPRLSNLYGRDEKKAMVDTYQETFRFTLLLLIPIVVGLFMISDTFILWFLGPDFVKTSLLLKWSCPLIALMTVGNFLGMQYLSPTGQQGKMSMIYLAAAAVNVVLNAVMIPRMLSEGAIIASVAAEAVSCGAQVWLLKKSEYNFRMLKGVWKYAVAAAVMAAVIYFFNSHTTIAGAVMTFTDIVLGAAAYFAVLIALREGTVTSFTDKVLSKLKK
ncbi:MAG: flippase [Oscillospiraceae bacterium]|nr:flippase [Oscillospiraceae bacterium]